MNSYRYTKYVQPDSSIFEYQNRKVRILLQGFGAPHEHEVMSAMKYLCGDSQNRYVVMIAMNDLK